MRFRPHNPSDVRLDGLTGLSPERLELDAMRGGIRRLLASTFELVLAGAAREEVYRRWRELTAGQVAEARARHSAPVRTRVALADVGRLVAPVRAAARVYPPQREPSHDPVTDVALSLDANLEAMLPVTLESLVSNASGPLRLWVTTRGLGPEYERWLAAAFPDVRFAFFACDDVDYGTVSRMIRHVSVATMDRLLLPEVLRDLDRLVYVDIDTVTDGDVCELTGIDLEGLPLAARTTFSSGALQWRLAATFCRRGRQRSPGGAWLPGTGSTSPPSTPECW